MAYPSPCSPFGDLHGSRPEPGARGYPGTPVQLPSSLALAAANSASLSAPCWCSSVSWLSWSSMDGPAGAACCGGGCWYCCGGGCWYCCCWYCGCWYCCCWYCCC